LNPTWDWIFVRVIRWVKNKVVRKTFERKKDEGTEQFRIIHNDELRDL